METRKLNKQFRIRGMLALEPAILLLIFTFVMMVINNGIVNVVHQDWISAAESAALGGVGKLYEELDEPNANQDAINEALALALMHTGLEGSIQASQVTVTLGQWSNCIFVPTSESPNAVRVDIIQPMDELGGPSGLTSFFGTFNVPLFQVINPQTTAVAAYYDEKGGQGKEKIIAVLVEYQGNVCIN